MSAKLKLVHTFDETLSRHYLNGSQSVLHCHHYATLYTQTAILAEDLNGVKSLFEAGEETFGGFLKDYFKNSGITSPEDRFSIARQYWKEVGMGLIEISADDAKSGRAKMDYSHIDEGWLKKWGDAKVPVNIFTRGFLAGAFSAVFDKPFSTYNVEETKSLSRGDEATEFTISVI